MDALDIRVCDDFLTTCGEVEVTRAGLQSLEDFGTLAAMLWTATDSEVELFGCAVGLLAGNADLIRWAICGVGGELAVPVYAEAIVSWVTGFKLLNLVFIENTDFSGSARDPSTYRAFSPYVPWVFIQRDSVDIQTWIQMWETGDLDTQLCAAIQVASLLLHEMTHSVHLDWGEWIGLYECNNSFMTQNTFQWAAFQRFPQAAESPCCGRLDSDSVFGCGETQYVSNLAPSGCTGSVPGDGWTDEIDEWFDGVGAWFGRVFPDTGGGGTGGPDPALCILCPSMCAGGGWAEGPHDPDDCFDEIVEWFKEKTEIEPEDKMSSSGRW